MMQRMYHVAQSLPHTPHASHRHTTTQRYSDLLNVAESFQKRSTLSKETYIVSFSDLLDVAESFLVLVDGLAVLAGFELSRSGRVRRAFRVRGPG